MSLPENIHLEIVTPDRQLFSGAVDEVTVPSNVGYLGILPGHAPLLAELGIGEISYKIGDRTDFLFLGMCRSAPGPRSGACSERGAGFGY